MVEKSGVLEGVKRVRQHASMLNQPQVNEHIPARGFAGFKHSMNCLPNPLRSLAQGNELSEILDDESKYE